MPPWVIRTVSSKDDLASLRMVSRARRVLAEAASALYARTCVCVCVCVCVCLRKYVPSICFR